jgi:hypothetical protein
MTVIAWDGKTLAADKQSASNGYATRATKIHRVPGGIVGFSGGATHAAELLEWFRDGRVSYKFPRRSLDDASACGALFISDEGVIHQYSADSACPEIIEEPFHARGAGRDFALAALYLGHDARKAVEVACALDVNCGCGIDALELE